MTYIPPSQQDDANFFPDAPERKLLIKVAFVEVVGKWLYRIQLFLIGAIFLQWTFVYRLMGEVQLLSALNMVLIGAFLSGLLVISVPLSIILEWQYEKYEALLNAIIFSRIDPDTRNNLSNLAESETFHPRIRLFTGYKNKRGES